MTDNPRAVPGDNSQAVPLSELLTEETASLAQRSADLIAATGRAAVTDDDTAGKAATLAKMIRDHDKAVEKMRVERKEPFLASSRAVDLHFNGLRSPLDAAFKKITGMIDAYRREQERKAAEERRRLEEEARELQRQADERRLAAQSDEVLGEDGEVSAVPSIEAEIEAETLQSRAEAVAVQATEIKAVPIVAASSGVKASGRKVWRVEITDLKKALSHALKIDEAAVRAAVQDVFNRQVRAGIRALPGARVIEDSVTIIK